MILIRPLRISDRDEYLVLMDTFRKIQTEVTEEEFEDVFNNIHDMGCILVAEEEDVLVGSVTVIVEHKFIHGLAKYAHIEDVIVLESHRHRGIGTQLVRSVIEWATIQDCYKATLVCAEDIVPFYSQCGFDTRGTCMSYLLRK